MPNEKDSSMWIPRIMNFVEWVYDKVIGRNLDEWTYLIERSKRTLSAHASELLMGFSEEYISGFIDYIGDSVVAKDRFQKIYDEIAQGKDRAKVTKSLRNVLNEENKIYLEKERNWVADTLFQIVQELDALDKEFLVKPDRSVYIGRFTWRVISAVFILLISIAITISGRVLPLYGTIPFGLVMFYFGTGHMLRQITKGKKMIEEELEKLEIKISD